MTWNNGRTVNECIYVYQMQAGALRAYLVQESKHNEANIPKYEDDDEYINIYVGKSNDPERRDKEHLRDSKTRMDKLYNKKNKEFIRMLVIESNPFCPKDYEDEEAFDHARLSYIFEREEFYVQKFDLYERPDGFNMTKGGGLSMELSKLQGTKKLTRIKASKYTQQMKDIIARGQTALTDFNMPRDGVDCDSKYSREETAKIGEFCNNVRGRHTTLHKDDMKIFVDNGFKMKILNDTSLKTQTNAIAKLSEWVRLGYWSDFNIPQMGLEAKIKPEDIDKTYIYGSKEIGQLLNHFRISERGRKGTTKIHPTLREQLFRGGFKVDVHGDAQLAKQRALLENLKKWQAMGYLEKCKYNIPRTGLRVKLRQEDKEKTLIDGSKEAGIMLNRFRKHHRGQPGSTKMIESLEHEFLAGGFKWSLLENK